MTRRRRELNFSASQYGRSRFARALWSEDSRKTFLHRLVGIRRDGSKRVAYRSACKNTGVNPHVMTRYMLGKAPLGSKKMLEIMTKLRYREKFIAVTSGRVGDTLFRYTGKYAIL